jgi:hypothetical protein
MLYKKVNKTDYLKIHASLTDPADIKFSKTAIGMWDFMKAWDAWGVRILEDEEGICCICFMKVSGQAGTKVLFLSNIFTPASGRGKGSARTMIDFNIKEAVNLGAETIRLDCNKSALGFYDKIGLSYWGTTRDKSMFCDLPIDSTGVSCFQQTKNKTAAEILDSYSERVRTAKIKWIYKKVKMHEETDHGHPCRYDDFMDIYNNKATLELLL